MSAPVFHRFASLASTQDLAHELAGQGAPAATVVVASEQTKGRGTRGREWSSGAGGLWLTVILRPTAPPALEGLSLRVGMRLAAALEAAAGVPIGVKWPNDLIARDRKLAGILCEARWLGDRPGWVAVGVGVNVANPIPSELADQAIRLADLGYSAGPETLAETTAAAVIAAGDAGGSLSDAELAEFDRRDWLRGRQVAQPVPGTVAGLAPDGRLVVLGADGARRLVAAPVSLPGLAPGGGSR